MDGPVEDVGAGRGPGGEDRLPYPGLLRTLLLLGAVIVLGGLFFQATYYIFPTWPDIARMAVPTQLALATVTAWAVFRSDRPWREALGFRGLEVRHVPPLLLILIGAVTVFSEIYVVIQRFVPVPAEFEAILRDLLELTNPADSLATLIIAIIIAPVLEEALFRGVILNGLARRYGPQSASFWTAVFFAFFHLYNPWQVLPTFFLGLVLAWLVLTTRSLLSAVVVHTMFNAASLVLVQLSLDRPPEGHPVPYVVVVIVLGMLAGSMALLTGMAWLEKQTGGGWFALPPVVTASGPDPGADAHPGSGSGATAGPTAVRR
ncbi:MAG TPA: type II CAAX endopeptidase family protein [Gemmatimonadota bacterium]|nr:type II CAAX endopeptidase family protein [Gemmatimonadota bacterium]